MLKLNNSWDKYLNPEFEKQYMKEIVSFIEKEKQSGKTIYPKEENIFNALNTTDFNNLKVVILGQDPYHGEGQAHGLSFSVQEGTKCPPSLKNIYKEIFNDLGIEKGPSGDLTSWAKQGVLLLNAILTVEAGIPASHSKIGWQNFTDEIISIISKEKSGVIFILWGAFAQGKEKLIDTKKHYILKSPHPSPFSVYRGFYGSKHFSKTNEILKELGKSEIDWGNNNLYCSNKYY